MFMTVRAITLKNIQKSLARKSLDDKWRYIGNSVARSYEDVNPKALFHCITTLCPYCDDAERRIHKFKEDGMHCSFCAIHPYLCHSRYVEEGNNLVDIVQDFFDRYRDDSIPLYKFVSMREGVNLMVKAFNEISKSGRMSRKLKREIKDYLIKWGQ